MTKDIHKDVKGQSEDALQQKCVFWFWNEYPSLRGLLFSVPNGGTRSGKEGKKLNLTGVVSGVCDLILLYNNRAFLIEMKTEHKRSKQSTNQRLWQEKVEAHGFHYFIVRSLQDFKELIRLLIT